jgi:endonuclease YncB( thermonuclease family)
LVIDGDTVEIHGKRIRLFGIDAVESEQRCQRDGKPCCAAGIPPSPWPNGRVAHRTQ